MPDHAHHWLIGNLADLPPDQGRCKLCGAVKTFQIYLRKLNYDEMNKFPGVLAAERDIIGYMAERTREK